MQKHLQKLKGLYKYLVAGIILAVPLFPKFPFINIPGTFVSIRLEDFLIAVTLLVWLIMSFPNLTKFLKGDIERAIFIFFAAGLLSTLFGFIALKTVVPYIGILHWIRRIEYLSLFYIGLLAIRNNPKDLDFYFKLLLITVILAFIYGYGQKHFSWPMIITQNEEYSKGIALRWIPGSQINSTFAGHYDLATFLVLVLPIIITSLFVIKGVKNNLILSLVTLAGLWLMVNTASRISLVSFLVSVTVSLVLVKKYKGIIIIVIATVLFASLSSNLVSRYSRLFDIIKSRFLKAELMMQNNVFIPAYASDAPVQRRINPTPTPTPATVSEDRSTSIRLNVEWPRAIRALAKNPILGTGYSSISLATDNDYLRMLGETGLLGFLAFILIFIIIIQKYLSGFPYLKRFDGLKLCFISGVFGSLAGVLLNAVFIDVFEASKFATIFWLLIGMSLGLIQHKSYEK